MIQNIPDIKKYLYIMKIIITGLLCSQIISFIHVYISNTGYFQKLSAINSAGYLVVPNLIVMEKLKGVESAFFGGFFFTLTVGACLTILSFAAARFWDGILSRQKFFLISIILFLLGCLYLVNANGFSFLVSIHFIIVPGVVFFAALKWFPNQDKNSVPGKAGIKILIHITCIAALAFMGTSRMNSVTYSLIRDNILLSAKPGISINNFYYSYTLYAAQVFKSVGQDMLRTCRISSSTGIPVSETVKKALINRDYLIVNTDDSCDLELDYSKESIKMNHKGKDILRTTEKEFLKNPGKMLKQFSQKCDKHVFFRQFTFISLLLVSGLFCYLLLYFPFRIITLVFCGKSLTGSFIAVVCCFIMCAGILYFWHPEKPKNFKKENLAQALKSASLDTRVAALKYISRKRMDIGKIGIPAQMPGSPIILERYWLAKALGSSKSSNTFDITLELLDDPQINVSYIAFNALAQRKDQGKVKRSIREILERIPGLKQWYVQLYAYKALRRLKWRQAGFQ